jgi:hypothetical protein
MKGSILAVALAFSSLGIPVAACIVDNAKPANQANAAAMDRCPYYPSPVVCGQLSGTVAAQEHMAAGERNFRQNTPAGRPLMLASEGA